MKKFIPILTCILFISFYSCKKNPPVDGDIRDPFIFPSDTPVLLTRMVLFDTTLLPNPDTVAIYDFTYDQSFRPVTFTFRQYYAGTVNYISNMKYEYQGADSLASRTTSVITSISGTTTITHDTMYYFYQGGKLIKDSLITEDGNHYERCNYQYLPDRILSDYLSVTTNPAYMFTRNSVFYKTISGGNLVQQHDTMTINYPGLTQYLAHNYTITYLNNPDPYYRVIKPIRRVYFDEADWIWDPIPMFVSPNLPSVNQHDNYQWNSTGSSSGINTCVYQYSFRPDGYPSIMYQVDHESGIYDAYFKIIYTYNK